MGLWRSILGWINPAWGYVNPTLEWEEDRSVPLVLDLDAHRFCGFGVRDPIEKLAFLGPAEPTHFGFAWPEKGIDVTLEKGIGELGIFFGHPEEPEGGDFSGVCRYRGAPLRLNRDLTEAKIVALFGEPYWRDQDKDEALLFYEFQDVEWQVEFGTDGGLKHLRLGEPILANAEDRKSYGVTKAWPPENSGVE